MKKLLLLLLFPATVHAQIDWDNYSTSFQGNGKEGKQPVLVTAIPYNGIYGGATYFSAWPEKLHYADSFYTADERRANYVGESVTIDSGQRILLRAAYPTLSGIYTAQNLKDFVASKRRFRRLETGFGHEVQGGGPLPGQINPEARRQYASSCRQSGDLSTPRRWKYQLSRNGSIDSAWKPNDFDNNLIFLQNLPPGYYTSG